MVQTETFMKFKLHRENGRTVEEENHETRKVLKRKTQECLNIRKELFSSFTPL